MLRALTAEQSRAVEERAVREAGLSLFGLMSRAGIAVADEVDRRYSGRRVCVLCGPGNNGGDGWVAARQLQEMGWEVLVIALRPPADLRAEAGRASALAVEAGVPWRDGSAGADADADPFEGADVLVDAMLGIGSRLPLAGAIAEWAMAADESGLPVVAVDLPTGADSDSGRADDRALAADCTLTFTAPKLGHVTYPAAGLAGDVVIIDIGIPAEYAEIFSAPEVWSESEFAALLPLPASDAHKYSRGRVLVVAGSARFPGAAILATRGAMRAGAGYVTLAVPEPVVAVAQSHLLAAPVVGLPAARSRTFSSAATGRLLDLAAEYDAVVLGPGLTLADGAVAMARELYARVDCPLVVDADALNALVDAPDLVTSRTAPTVLTPHPGELARMLGATVTDVQADRVCSSARLAGRSRTVVLKGAGTVVSDGERQVVVTAGTPALATAGSGDVLSGVIGALLAQGLTPLEAGALGAQVHGRAGEAAADALSPICVTAEDLPDYLPVAVRDMLSFDEVQGEVEDV